MLIPAENLSSYLTSALAWAKKNWKLCAAFLLGFILGEIL